MSRLHVNTISNDRMRTYLFTYRYVQTDRLMLWMDGQRASSEYHVSMRDIITVYVKVMAPKAEVHEKPCPTGTST